MATIEQKTKELNELRDRALKLIDEDFKNAFIKRHTDTAYKIAKKLSETTDARTLRGAALQFKFLAERAERVESIREDIKKAKNFKTLWSVVYDEIRGLIIYDMSGNKDNLRSKTEKLADDIGTLIIRYK